jgi:peptidoglycan hydrolase CwlO-like protein
MFVVCLAGCFSLLFARNAAKSAPDEYEKKIEEKHLALDSIKSELVKGREKLKQLQQQEGSYVSQLEQLEKNIGISKSYMKRLDTKIDSASHTIGDLEASLALENRKLKDRQEEMKVRFRTCCTVCGILRCSTITTGNFLARSTARGPAYRRAKRPSKRSTGNCLF